jgi:hypothetical protein
MTLVLSGTSGVALDSIKNSLMFLETAQATTSGTFKDFTGIPSWAKKITVMFNGVSTNGTSFIQVQLGTSGGIETTGYSSGSANIYGTNACGQSTSTTGLVSNQATFGSTRYGHYIITLMESNLWVASHTLGDNSGNAYGGGTKTLSGTLDRVRLTTTNGTDTFDAGSVNILIEGYV